MKSKFELLSKKFVHYVNERILNSSSVAKKTLEKKRKNNKKRHVINKIVVVDINICEKIDKKKFLKT